ncbi:unnamed protein product [Prorocentrum cordatum]|uniref:Uncharacterized protein n=1 Tax=Prorocentrum cordatum TaxID=2364126 RepID=A0ABN9UM21_9DINO|nr:unnamed protein product [Polarella glacialis]
MYAFTTSTIERQPGRQPPASCTASQRPANGRRIWAVPTAADRAYLKQQVFTAIVGTIGIVGTINNNALMTESTLRLHTKIKLHRTIRLHPNMTSWLHPWLKLRTKTIKLHAKMTHTRKPTNIRTTICLVTALIMNQINRILLCVIPRPTNFV